MLAIGICGVGGRMGQRLAALVSECEDLRLTACTEAPGHALVGQDAGAACGCAPLGVTITTGAEALAAASVVMDFTRPEVTLNTAQACAAAGTAMVVGTTGFTPAQLAEFGRLTDPIACVLSPNFSTAMNLLFKLVRDAAAVLGDDYDVEIVEAHHRHKVDAPSGTALRLAEQVAAGLELDLAKVAVHGRHGLVGARPRHQIGIHAVRAGDLVGDHTVLYAAPGECLELHHRATSRDALAQGALRAARFVAAARPGLYSMWDVLGIA
jgi:4-hydroxy-tetrahydrodipicolinate reductase